MSERDDFREAYVFTIKREERIRLKKEEICIVRNDRGPGHDHPGDCGCLAIYDRILTKLQAELDELRRGMKEASDG